MGPYVQSIFREQEDIQRATMESLGVADEFANIEETDREAGTDDGDLTCGVDRCPQASTVWASHDRLERHR